MYFFLIFSFQPALFFVLDEIDAALDSTEKGGSCRAVQAGNPYGFANQQALQCGRYKSTEKVHGSDYRGH
jgi:hypothetical protein